MSSATKSAEDKNIYKSPWILTQLFFFSLILADIGLGYAACEALFITAMTYIGWALAIHLRRALECGSHSSKNMVKGWCLIQGRDWGNGTTCLFLSLVVQIHVCWPHSRCMYLKRSTERVLNNIESPCGHWMWNINTLVQHFVWGFICRHYKDFFGWRMNGLDLGMYGRCLGTA